MSGPQRYHSSRTKCEIQVMADRVSLVAAYGLVPYVIEASHALSLTRAAPPEGLYTDSLLYMQSFKTSREQRIIAQCNAGNLPGAPVDNNKSSESVCEERGQTGDEGLVVERRHGRRSERNARCKREGATLNSSKLQCLVR